METDRIADLELLLGHHFKDTGYIQNALSHSSVKSDRRPSNERLEFLGDSVLGLVVADVLYRRFPDDDEGELTRIKSQAVSRATLQRIALAMGLDRYILVGKGVMKREIPASLLGNLFEAIVGAIYLDAGIDAARKFILRHLDVVIEEIIEDRAERNYKSLLQHYCQRDLGAIPTYRVLRESGPAHGRNFEVAILISGKEYGRAKAASKKEAEQGAARAAMIHFKQVEENPKDPTRGAGVILRVGGNGNPKGRRKRAGRQGSKPADTPAVEEATPVRTPGREKETSRRRGSRGGRRRSRARDKKREAPAAEPAPAADRKPPDEKPARTGRKKTRRAPRKKTAKSPRKKAKRDRSKGDAASD